MNTAAPPTAAIAQGSDVPPPHPACLLLPPMTADEYVGLKADVAQHGLRRPILLFEGKILDGRHRAQACEELGIGARYETWGGTDPIGFVLSENLHRRHLTLSQRAMVAAGAMEAHKTAARERQLAGQTLVSHETIPHSAGNHAQTVAPRGANAHSCGKAAATVAAAAGVSPRSVERAVQIRARGTENDVQEVLAGKTTVNAKVREIAEREPAASTCSQQPATPQGPAKALAVTRGPTPKEAMQRALAVTAALAELRKVDAVLLPEDAKWLAGELKAALERYRARLASGGGDA